MKLNLPLFDRLSVSSVVLIAGMGGGYDVFCGIPIYHTLRQAGFAVHLASYSLADVKNAKGGISLSDTLVGVRGESTITSSPYFPERHLAQFLSEVNNEKVIVWSFHKTGVRPLIDNYQLLLDRLGVTDLILVDGGVDSLMRGDESKTGTLVEDTVSLVAANELKNLASRTVACLGMGAELDIDYGAVFENIAALTRLGGFLGACALTPGMEAYKIYEQTVLFAQAQDSQDSSVINSSVISAVQGRYGNAHLTTKTRGSKLWISPLMPLYWFFDVRVLARRSLLYDNFRRTDHFLEAYRAYLRVSKTLVKRPRGRIGLSS
jgi:hypothetical protein